MSIDNLKLAPPLTLPPRRWYGSPEPGDNVFVERKTHRESWKGEESVKDRITLPKGKIVEFLDGTYTLDMAMKEGKVHPLPSHPPKHPLFVCCTSSPVCACVVQMCARLVHTHDIQSHHFTTSFVTWYVMCVHAMHMTHA